MFTSLLHPFRLVREGKKMSLWVDGTRDLELYTDLADLKNKIIQSLKG